MPLAMLHVACSTAVRYEADRYSACADLGELVLSSSSPEEAEQRMTARVLALGGNTLLFGERGRSTRLNAVPQEIVDRREEILGAADVTDDRQPVVVVTTDETEPAQPNVISGTQSVGQRPVITTTPIPVSPGELWYYGAALRCNR